MTSQLVSRAILSSCSFVAHAVLQIQPVASFCSTVLGTAIRIPCEVLKQRLQAGMFQDVPSALRATLREDGVRGLFRGTTATLLREVPFYVFGMLIYLQVKNVSH